MDDTLYKLVNPPMDIEWNGTVYHVKKANLEKIVLYQEKAKLLSESKDSGGDAKLTAYCIYLVLRDVIPELTEDQVMKETPGDIAFVDVAIKLGFLNTTRMKALLQTIQKPTGDASLPTSQTGQDGVQEKSAS